MGDQDGRPAAAALNDDLRPTRKKKNERLKSESEPGKGRWKKKHFESRRKKESNNNNNNNKDDGTGDTGEEWGIYMCEGKGNLSIFFFPYLYLSFFFSLFRCRRIETER